ncbi:bestrophin family ion channel [Paraflavitalea sp. CAU 1676]|uniref:bestrophin family protein n=1 Tax=Paraflavitalea sp. CAU 1676 TaxID=3032598 RepID=UPI0023DA6BA3|nr:bestrophin family ion channel [Paraflavitalea sp. CAU 1676]MDF2186809.1 bestrophin family ion channel [Paraflavitalea sp. CAU 1676]
MHTGKSYTLFEFLVWTRRNIFWLLVVGSIPTLLYEVFGMRWLSIPWPVVAMLGTATAFIVGFKNAQSYSRTWEARQVWGAAIGATRAWAMMCRDYVDDPEKAKEVIYRQLAWLTALRHQLRAHKDWETSTRSYNKEYTRYYTIPERETSLEKDLSKYLTEEEVAGLMPTNNKAVQLLGLQSAALKGLHTDGVLEHFRFLDMHTALREFSSHQGKCERIKNFPYPRQYATINTLFIRIFCVLLPFALLGEFNELNEQVTGVLRGSMVWFVIPFSMLVSWVYTSLEQVGESTENPFEANPNAVPISQMSRAVEIDIREMLGETDLPPALQARNNIVL